LLELKNITKDYLTGTDKVEALKGVNLSFRPSEFACILGPSGCGKTTLLNIVGGLDRYTSGDLLIKGRSTKNYKDADWDAYRNRSIGFIFQNYNLIQHISVLQNVELALTIGGITAAERRERATAALLAVGLGDKLKSKPNQLSGGQTQRVSIARALVNNPDIILADEPTGALDSAISVQIMDILKEVAKDRLVIMVTHNIELTEKYGTRVISLLDGRVISDSNPYTSEEDKVIAPEPAPADGKPNLRKVIRSVFVKYDHTSMSYATAIGLSFKNLMTKKVRTAITAFAGSIGIIGVGLVLAISNGFGAYIDKLEKDNLSGFPVVVSEMAINDNIIAEMNPMTLTAVENVEGLPEFPAGDRFTMKVPQPEQNPMDMLENMVKFNKLTPEFYTYAAKMEGKYGSIQYTYGVDVHFIFKTSAGAIDVVDNNADYGLQQLLGDRDFIDSQYTIIAGDYPTNPYDAVLIVDKYNRLDKKVSEALGFPPDKTSFTAEELMNSNIKLVFNDGYYKLNSLNHYERLVRSTPGIQSLYDEEVNSAPINIKGILRIKPSAKYEMMTTGIGYTDSLLKSLMAREKTSEVVIAQLASDEIDVINGKSLKSVNIDPILIITNMMAGGLADVIKAAGKFYNQDDLAYLKRVKLQELGGDDTPIAIYLFPKDYSSKAAAKAYLDRYNDGLEKEDRIQYMDMAEAMTSMVGEMINIVSIVLVCFAGIALVVSSIMIGIITYVSVVERTKEIGILRSIGARKLDVSNVFNAETAIIGFSSGVAGIIATYLLSIPVNLIIRHYTGIADSLAALNPLNALYLILVSVGLTVIAGLIPATIAAKRDPVVALRTE
jgi:ABC-type antimicrobial peptide transport system, ATPase component